MRLPWRKNENFRSRHEAVDRHDLSPGWVTAFADAGIEATHWSTVGPFAAVDTEIMSYALPAGCWVVTNDLDFGAILAATGAAAPSVIQIRGSSLMPEEIGPQVIRGLRQAAMDLARGALLTVDAQRIRIRVLPFEAIGRNPAD